MDSTRARRARRSMQHPLLEDRTAASIRVHGARISDASRRLAGESDLSSLVEFHIPL